MNKDNNTISNDTSCNTTRTGSMSPLLSAFLDETFLGRAHSLVIVPDNAKLPLDTTNLHGGNNNNNMMSNDKRFKVRRSCSTSPMRPKHMHVSSTDRTNCKIVPNNDTTGIPVFINKASSVNKSPKDRWDMMAHPSPKHGKSIKSDVLLSPQRSPTPERIPRKTISSSTSSFDEKRQQREQQQQPQEQKQRGFRQRPLSYPYDFPSLRPAPSNTLLIDDISKNDSECSPHVNPTNKANVIDGSRESRVVRKAIDISARNSFAETGNNNATDNQSTLN